MKIKNKVISKLQMGGGVPPEAPVEQPVPEQPVPGGEPGAPGAAPEGGSSDPLMEIANVAMQAMQTQDCQAALAVCDAFLQMVNQAQGGGAAPEQPAEPTFQKKGGKLVRKG